MRYRLGDERLTAPRRTIEQHALRRLEIVLAVELWVQERQLDGIADEGDLLVQTADVLVRDVRNFLQRELRYLSLVHAFGGYT